MGTLKPFETSKFIFCSEITVCLQRYVGSMILSNMKSQTCQRISVLVLITSSFVPKVTFEICRVFVLIFIISYETRLLNFYIYIYFWKMFLALWIFIIAKRAREKAVTTVCPVHVMWMAWRTASSYTDPRGILVCPRPEV